MTEKWSCRSYKAIKPGDKAFLARVGVSPRVIIGTGIVTTPPFLSRHWSGENKDVYRVMIQFDVLLNADKEPILTHDILNHGKLTSPDQTPKPAHSLNLINLLYCRYLLLIYFD